MMPTHACLVYMHTAVSSSSCDKLNHTDVVTHGNWPLLLCTAVARHKLELNAGATTQQGSRKLYGIRKSLKTHLKFTSMSSSVGQTA